jgi:superoxide reductase
MTKLTEFVHEANWKEEKHVPVIECPDKIKSGEVFSVKASIGKEISHPNTTEHHIRWISLYFLADGDKFPFHVGHFEFAAHGESVQGPNQGPVSTHHEVTAALKLGKSGTLYALSFCNIHGLWQSEKAIKVI